MDNRLASDIVGQREVIDQILSRMPTHCPGIIQSFDKDTGLVTVIPAVKMKAIVDNIVTYLTMPKIIKCPVDIPFAQVAGFALTLPIRAGDSCNIHFSQRAIDNWLSSGGIQNPEDTPGSCRHHSLTDAIVSVGPSDLTKVLTDWLTDGIELRNRDRSVRISLTDTGVEVAGPVNFKDPVTFEAAALFLNTITDSLGVEHTTHIHPVAGVQAGTDTIPTGVPTP